MTQPGRVAAITGAASGIGFTSAERLAADGFTVLMIDRSDAVAERAAELRAKGHDIDIFVGDLVKSETIDAIRDHLAERHGRCDVLLNNAGVSSRTHGQEPSFQKTTREDWEFVFAVNLTAPFLLSQAIFPLMQEKQWGRIINISSRAGRTLVRRTGVPYHASKAGIIGLTRALAGLGGRHGITANTIAPGRIVTPLSATSPEDAIADNLRQIPVRRLGTTHDIASAVSFLASEESSFITGATLDVNGGGFVA